MYTADMARKAVQDAESINGQASREETLRILKKIEYEASRGKRNLTLAMTSGDHQVIKKRLELLGFTVTVTYDQRDGDYYAISW